MDYIVVIHTSEEGGYWGEIPALPGCYIQGDTIDDLLSDARPAIESHIEALIEDGQDVPDEPIVVASVRLPEPMHA